VVVVAGMMEDAVMSDVAVNADSLPNFHGLVVVRSGEVVLEQYGVGEDSSWGNPLGRVAFDGDTLHDLRSVTKSLVGLLYGIARDEGKVPAPEDQLLHCFAAYPDLVADPARRELRVEHALTMTMGTAWDESLPYTDPANSEIAMERAPDRYRFILDRPMIAEPGARWNYNGGATALLGRLIGDGTGLSLPEFARDTLFARLGISEFEWARGFDGTPSAASGLRLRPRDLARVGQLVLQNGVWDGQRVVSEEFLDTALKPQVAIDTDMEYGYQWFVGKARFLRAPASWIGARGNGGQRLWVVPSRDLVVVTTFGNYDQPEQSVAPDRLFREVASAAE
jgi:CubicO group peptidase (beta-lactamase class C family)